MWTNWDMRDNDCYQWMRQNEADLFEMIEVVWLDTTSEDLDRGLHPYIVVREEIDLNDFTDEEIEMYLAPYQLTLSGLRDDDKEGWKWMAAECILEEVILRDHCVVAEFDTMEEAIAFITHETEES